MQQWGLWQTLATENTQHKYLINYSDFPIDFTGHNSESWLWPSQSTKKSGTKRPERAPWLRQICLTYYSRQLKMPYSGCLLAIRGGASYPCKHGPFSNMAQLGGQSLNMAWDWCCCDLLLVLRAYELLLIFPSFGWHWIFIYVTVGCQVKILSWNITLLVLTLIYHPGCP